MNLSRPIAGAGPTTALLVSLIAVGPSGPALAQGGLICDVGPADYRRCCKESYARNPELGLRARAEEIEACLKGATREAPAAERRDSDRDRAEETPAEPSPPPQNPPVVLRSSVASPIRRITCASEPCEKGCSADEMAISAFCSIGSFPTLAHDGAVRCATTVGSKTEVPIVLFCAKR